MLFGIISALWALLNAVASVTAMSSTDLTRPSKPAVARVPQHRVFLQWPVLGIGLGMLCTFAWWGVLVWIVLACF
jgi:hypothetical protein